VELSLIINISDLSGCFHFVAQLLAQDERFDFGSMHFRLYTYNLLGVNQKDLTLVFPTPHIGVA